MLKLVIYMYVGPVYLKINLVWPYISYTPHTQQLLKYGPFLGSATDLLCFNGTMGKWHNPVLTTNLSTDLYTKL